MLFGPAARTGSGGITLVSDSLGPSKTAAEPGAVAASAVEADFETSAPANAVGNRLWSSARRRSSLARRLASAKPGNWPRRWTTRFWTGSALAAVVAQGSITMGTATVSVWPAT